MVNFIGNKSAQNLNINENKKLKSSALVAFLHIPKTAETSLNEIIHNNYDQSTIFYRYPPEKVSQIESGQSYRIVIGHFSFNDIKNLGQLQYFTFLRNPLNRIISNYNYQKRFLSKADLTLYEANRISKLKEALEKSKNIRDYIKLTKQWSYDNMQVRMLSGKGQKPPIGSVTNDILEIAKQNIKAHFFL